MLVNIGCCYARTFDGGTWDSASQQYLCGGTAGRFKSLLLRKHLASLGFDRLTFQVCGLSTWAVGGLAGVWGLSGELCRVRHRTAELS